MPETVQLREIKVKITNREAMAYAPINRPEHVARFVRQEIEDDVREHAVAIYTDGRNQPIGWWALSTGSQTASIVQPAMVYGPALSLFACGVLLAHNHPSDLADPSAEDAALTRRLVLGGRLLGVELLDHVVVGASTWTSLRESEPLLFE